MIPTTRKLRLQHRRLDRLIADARRTLELMEAGAQLTFSYRPTARWTLCPGEHVRDEVARLVTKNVYVVPVDNTLFDGATSQAFRWQNVKESNIA